MEHIANKSQFETIIKLIRGTYYWGEWSMENDQFHLVKMSSEQLDCQGSKLIVLMEESLKNLIGFIKIDPNICYEDNSKFVDKCMQVCDHYELSIILHQDTGSTLFNSDETVRNPTLLSAIERRETVEPIEQQIGQIDKEEFYMSLVDRTMSVEQKLEQKLNQNSEMDRLKKLFNQKATIAEKMDIVRMLKKADWTLEDMVYVDLKPRLGNNIFDKLWYVWRFESDETFRRKLIDLSTDYIISVDLLKIIAPMYNEQLYDDVNFWLDKLSSETNSSKIVDEIRALRREKREEKQKNEKKPKKEKRKRGILNREHPEISLQITLKSNQFGEPGNDDFTVELSIKFTENYPEGIPETTIDGIDEKFEVTRIFEAIEKMKAVAEENLCMVMVFAIVSAMQEEMEELLNVKRRRLLEIEQKGATLNLSDMTLIGAQDEVEIDESLFDKEMPTQSPPFSTGPCNTVAAKKKCTNCF
ncbi:unnamed protein product [Caenorhabditis angaria]|uniref:RWD domain-containing protein n=1 Tax=Caenorhabditis angaria TaxID=860376 RepID=A0A9P1IHE9_9PELO|nr:unnamed protein product [Caenorhabditis angaria]